MTSPTAAASQRTEEQAARRLGISVVTLRNWRWRKIGPAYLKVGRNVFYLDGDIDEWLEGQRRNPAAS